MKKTNESDNIEASFDEFLQEEETLNETTALAHKRVLAWQIEQEMKSQHVTQVEMAKRMQTSPTAVHRLLDPNNPGITLDTIARAVSALGMKLNISITSSSL